jgi:hypothetical protein
MKHTDLLDMQVIAQNGSLQRVRRWWRGIRPRKGVISHGWTGLETVEEFDRVPLRLFSVTERPKRG